MSGFDIDDFDNLVAAVTLARINEALETAGAVGVKAFEADQVPAKRPAEYLKIALSRRFGGQLNVGGRLSVIGYRLAVTAVSQHAVENARRSLSTAGRAVEFRRLVVASQESTPVQFETARAVAPDDSWFSGTTNYTFAI